MLEVLTFQVNACLRRRHGPGSHVVLLHFGGSILAANRAELLPQQLVDQPALREQLLQAG